MSGEDHAIGKPVLTGSDSAPPLILASGSPVRRQLLEQAGIPVRTDRPGVDESEIKAGMGADGAASAEVAEALAETKARRISPRYPGALVLGADQMLDLDGTWLDKPANRDEAWTHLQRLRGGTHRLSVSAVVVQDGTRLWHQTEMAELTMRQFSDSFLEAYLDAVGDAALDSVGAYQLEGLGAQLFARIRGDYFTILGLPLLPLLGFLRAHKVIRT